MQRSEEMMTMTHLIVRILNIKRIVAPKWIFYSCIRHGSAEAGGSKKFLTKSYLGKVHMMDGQTPWWKRKTQHVLVQLEWF